MQNGYYRFPTINQDTVIFISEDDMWTIPATGGIARRLTANLGEVSDPMLSPDGQLLAFTGRDEGETEVYCMPATGGQAKRLTYLGVTSTPVGWTRDGKSIIFTSNTAQSFYHIFKLYTISPEGGQIEALPTGEALSISYGANGGVVISQNAVDLAGWKRYRGGRCGKIWIDPHGKGEWQTLIKLDSNLASPLWLDERIYFVADHEGIGNIYSCLPNGENLDRHTHHNDYFVRFPNTDGKRIVYQVGAELYLFDPSQDTSEKINIEFHSPRTQTQRKFVNSSYYFESYSIHPEGLAVAITTRGKVFSMANWEAAVMDHNTSPNARYRLAKWLHAGEHLAIVSDETGEETIEIHHFAKVKKTIRLEGLNIGRPIISHPSPKKNEIALTNHRYELIVVDIAEKTARVLDKSKHGRILGIAWSPDGVWLAYGFAQTGQTSCIKLCHVETGEKHVITNPVLRDGFPAFDPEGKYLYFLSRRSFNPVRDNMHFDWTFIWGSRPCLITLQENLYPPFVPMPRAPGDKPPDIPTFNHPDRPDDENNDKVSEVVKMMYDLKIIEKKEDESIQIDLEGIANRVIPFPVAEGRYGQIRGIKGKALYSVYPVTGALNRRRKQSGGPPAKGKLKIYDFAEQSSETIVSDITSFDIAMDGKTLIYRSQNNLRVIKAGDKPSNDNGATGRKSGWIDLSRIRLSVDPCLEWHQMYREAWRLQRDHFWTEDMSGVDWQKVYKRYLPLLKRVGTRSEFSDVMWEMQGELGTSHAYEYGGDYRDTPFYTQGLLGADFEYDPETDSYIVTHIVHGDVWSKTEGSPLSKPFFNVKVGDRLISVNGNKVSRDLSPHQLLVNQAGNDVFLIFESPELDRPKNMFVKTLYTEFRPRYREWINKNRQRVHEASAGQIGYVHIPDMGAEGFAEFHRGFLTEVDRKGLIVDVRNNRGGNVSPLILEKLARKRLGYDISRWGRPEPYPTESVEGPIVALCNNYSASDGDIFCHSFRAMGLGKLIGTRTWGGVIGIFPRFSLVDKTITTQPEFSSWFYGVGWNVENHGVEPDIEVIISPRDDIAGKDPQLERAISEIMQTLKDNPPTLPDFGDRPKLSLPTLPDEK